MARSKSSSRRSRSAAARSIPSSTSTGREDLAEAEALLRRARAMSPPAFGVVGLEEFGQDHADGRPDRRVHRRGYRVSRHQTCACEFRDRSRRAAIPTRCARPAPARCALSSPRRFALMRELGDAPEMSFDRASLLMPAGCDLVLVEGYKREAFPEDRDPPGRRRSRANRWREASRRSWRSPPTGPATKTDASARLSSRRYQRHGRLHRRPFGLRAA